MYAAMLVLAAFMAFAMLVLAAFMAFAAYIHTLDLHVRQRLFGFLKNLYYQRAMRQI